MGKISSGSAQELVTDGIATVMADSPSIYSSIVLSKNSQFYVRQGDVERLIAQGYLQRLS